MFKLGLVINPIAGIGGRVALKGSDGRAIQQLALNKGAEKQANIKAEIGLKQIVDLKSQCRIFTASGEMGANLSEKLGLDFQVVYETDDSKANSTSAADTENAVKAIQNVGVDLILFVGGDGTARNIYQSVNENQLVLGLPAGVKIHSGVYAISAKSAGIVLRQLIKGELLSVKIAEVVDLDEEAFRRDKVKTQYFGELRIPAALEYVQAVKQGGQEVEEMVLADIAACVVEDMEDDTHYAIGSGSTCAAIMQELGLDNTLLGIDVIKAGKLIKKDASESELLAIAEKDPHLIFYITVIGGQGHLLGRGNHQISPKLIQKLGWDQFKVIATKTKIKALNGAPLRVDSGDERLDDSLCGSQCIITGYRETVVYPIR